MLLHMVGRNNVYETNDYFSVVCYSQQIRIALCPPQTYDVSPTSILCDLPSPTPTKTLHKPAKISLTLKKPFPTPQPDMPHSSLDSPSPNTQFVQTP